MIADEVLIRLLQFSMSVGTVSLLITCMRMDGVKWWLPVPIYIVSFSCLVTFLTTIFMRKYTFDLCVITLFFVAIAGIGTMVNSLVTPLPASRQDARNRRILYFVLPLITGMLVIWCIGVTYETGTSYFSRFEKFFGELLKNQRAMIEWQGSTEDRLSEIEENSKKQSGVSADYRDKLDDRLQAMNLQIKDLSLRIHRLQTEKQKEPTKRR